MKQLGLRQTGSVCANPSWMKQVLNVFFFFFSPSRPLCLFQVEKAQPRPGRRKPPPVIFASLGLSATWTQRMFGEFEQRVCMVK